MKQNHPALVNNSGSLAYLLNEKAEYIAGLLGPGSSVGEIKAAIANLIKEHYNLTPATKRFLTSLSMQTTKNDISQLVWNTILAGDNLNVI